MRVIQNQPLWLKSSVNHGSQVPQAMAPRLHMSANELINGIVRAGPNGASRYAADFTVLLHRGEFESYAGASRADLTARWSGGTEFVDLNPSPYLVLALVDEPGEYRIVGIRPLSDVLLLLTVEPKDGSSSGTLR